ncbi:MAG TPA: ECF-type sigma factor [Thermoanaerobaculia bacterium]|nr:ECF-type sigma factor [Thermoanaerobaculia bacterium]
MGSKTRPEADRSRIAELLAAHQQGDHDAFSRLVSLLYEDLRRLARAQRRRRPPGATLDTTALVHEVYLRLAGRQALDYQDRNHFLSIAARAMRFVLVEQARRHFAEKRGGGAVVDAPTEAELGARSPAADFETVLTLERALELLGERSERLVRVVECRYYAGMTEEEVASALGVSARTVQRDWRLARAQLKLDIEGAASQEEGRGRPGARRS